MLRVLIKKQIFQMYSSFFCNRKTGKKRSLLSTILVIFLYAVLMLGCMGGMFAYMGDSLCIPLHKVGMDWMYMTIFASIAMALGIFASVFNTFNSLYQAKDNDLLLSLPIEPKKIVLARLSGVYLLGTMFSGLVMIPGVLVYGIEAKPGVIPILFAIGLFFAVSLIILVFSCMLGWIVAKIAIKLKNRSFVTVLVSLVFIGLYYFVYFRASAVLNQVAVKSVLYGEKIKGVAYPLYFIGKAGAGDLSAFLVCLLLAVLLVWITIVVMSKSFLAIATNQGGTVKVVYKRRKIKAKTVSQALFVKEMKRFTSSANYMLNCGLGTILILVAAGTMLIKGPAAMVVLREVFQGEAFQGEPNLIPLLMCLGLCSMAGMNDITAPSITLEGKCIWIPQSLPVAAWQVLWAKLKVHLCLTIVPVVLCCISAIIVVQPTRMIAVLMLALPVLYVWFSACFGLVANLLFPNLNWTTEIAAVKQNMVVLLSMLVGMLLSIGTIILYFVWLGEFVSAEVYLGFYTLLLLVSDLGMIQWLRTKGSDRFKKI